VIYITVFVWGVATDFTDYTDESEKGPDGAFPIGLAISNTHSAISTILINLPYR